MRKEMYVNLQSYFKPLIPKLWWKGRRNELLPREIGVECSATFCWCRCHEPSLITWVVFYVSFVALSLFWNVSLFMYHKKHGQFVLGKCLTLYRWGWQIARQDPLFLSNSSGGSAVPMSSSISVSSGPFKLYLPLENSIRPNPGEWLFKIHVPATTGKGWTSGFLDMGSD